jgi:hypothetical protein
MGSRGSIVITAVYIRLSIRIPLPKESGEENNLYFAPFLIRLNVVEEKCLLAKSLVANVLFGNSWEVTVALAPLYLA